ncbi:TPA: hypothetical protein ACS61N_004469 [Klebsiella oxytoca]
MELMHFNISHPMKVLAFGWGWNLTPWLEPMWWIDGRLAALEILRLLKEVVSGEWPSVAVFFSQLSLPEHFRIVRWQLDILVLMKPWCAAREVPVSLNDTCLLVMVLLSYPEIKETLLMLASHVGLEISEFLSEDKQSREGSPLLNLQRLTPLSLGDFCAGSTRLLLLGISLKVLQQLPDRLPNMFSYLSRENDNIKG